MFEMIGSDILAKLRNRHKFTRGRDHPSSNYAHQEIHACDEQANR